MLKKTVFSHKLKGLIMLLLSTLLWAGSFLASRILNHWPLDILLWGRFLGAFLLASPFLMLAFRWKYIVYACLPGLLVALVIGIQTWCLRFESVSMVAFLSSFYFFFVTMLQWGFKASWQNPKVRLSLLLATCALCLFYLPSFPLTSPHRWIEFFSSFEKLKSWGIATLLLAGAFLASLHLVWVERLIQGQNLAPFSLAMWGHGATASILSFLLWNHGSVGALRFQEFTFFNRWVLPSSLQLAEISAFLFLTLGSTFLAFWWQFLGQKYLSSTEAGFVFILEAPLATILSFLWGWESISPQKWLGIGLFITALVTILKAQTPPK